MALLRVRDGPISALVRPVQASPKGSVRNRVKLLEGSLSETFSWVQQRPSARPSIIMLF